ncbi:putative oxidoreductase EphD [Aquamicrobium terrae]
MKRNGTALVTGASSGLGVAFVHALAARGYDVALSARSQAPMERLADEIRQAHGVAATVHLQDLSEPGSAAALVAQLDAQGIAPDVLVNNAAFGLHGPFVDYDPARLTAMLQLNMVSLAELTLLLGRRMWQDGSGHILLTGSGAAFQPTPTMAGYGATKAFLLSLGEALHVELAPKVGVTVVSPGTMETGFNAVSGFTPPPALQRLTLPVERVAREGLDAMFAGRANVVPGFGNKLGALTSRILSRQAAARLFARMAQGG